MTILKSMGTWCVQGKLSLIGNLPNIIQQQAITVQSRDTIQLANHINEVQPLECILLYWAIRMVVNPVNNPDPAIEFRLRRNQSTTLATIDFEPLETGVKAQLLSIPILSNENFDFETELFGSGNCFFSWLFAGKLTGIDPNG